MNQPNLCLTLLLSFGLATISSCSGAASSTNASRRDDSASDRSRRGPGETFLASAPPGFSLRDLGRPFTPDFRRFQGTDGETLFPDAGAPLRTAQHRFEHDVDVVDSEEKLAANAGAWGIAGELSEQRATRYASVRVVEIEDVREVDDTTAMKRAPRGATYYPWRIYMGRSYEVVLQGSSERFDSGVRANLLVYSGAIEDFARNHDLRHTVRARGLEPADDKAIFASTPDEIESHYRETIEEPVPILVEWRRIPGRDVDTRPIEWKELRTGCRGEPGCEPCRQWSFHRLDVGISGRKDDGRAWDGDGSPPDVVLTLRAVGDHRTSSKVEGYDRSWVLKRPLLVGANDMIRLIVIDKDLMMDDPIFTLQEKPGETLAGGQLVFGNGSATAFGTCVE